MAEECKQTQKQKIPSQSGLKFRCFRCPSACFAILYGGFYTMWTFLAKGLFWASFQAWWNSSYLILCFLRSWWISTKIKHSGAIYQRGDRPPLPPSLRSWGEHVRSVPALFLLLKVFFLQNTCNCSQKNMTCRYNFAENTHRCECPPKSIGENCEIRKILNLNTIKVKIVTAGYYGDLLYCFAFTFYVSRLSFIIFKEIDYPLPVKRFVRKP